MPARGATRIPGRSLTWQHSSGTSPGSDGWCVEDGDCDDTDSHVYPGHNDTKGRWGRDGVDNDCNGVIDG